jgi:uncharacterized membrane protein
MRLSKRDLHRKGDEGVILVLWVLALAALAGFLALVIDLGNLEQSSDNVQNAADAAAVSGAQILNADLMKPEPPRNAAFQAANDVESLVNTYGVNANWSGCSGAGPPGFSVAKGGETCIQYDVSSSDPSDPTAEDVIFWVRVVTPVGPSFIVSDGVTSLRKTAWASSAVDGLCSGMQPSGNC